MTTITSADIAGPWRSLRAAPLCRYRNVWEEVGHCCPDCQVHAIAEMATQLTLTGSPDAGQAVIIPALDGSYVELAGSGPARFRKHILTLNQPFVHPRGQAHQP